MPVVTKKYLHTPLYVDAVEVTVENMQAVADWCDGEIQHLEAKGKAEPVSFIKVNVIRPLRPRQSQAFVGDYILRTAKGLTVYNPKAFISTFVPADEVNTKLVPKMAEFFVEPARK